MEFCNSCLFDHIFSLYHQIFYNNKSNYVGQWHASSGRTFYLHLLDVPKLSIEHTWEVGFTFSSLTHDLACKADSLYPTLQFIDKLIHIAYTTKIYHSRFSQLSNHGPKTKHAYLQNSKLNLSDLATIDENSRVPIACIRSKFAPHIQLWTNYPIRLLALLNY